MLYYAALRRFDQDNGERWIGYTRWLGRTDLQRIVTLDNMICPAALSYVPTTCDQTPAEIAAPAQ